MMNKLFPLSFRQLYAVCTEFTNSIFSKAQRVFVHCAGFANVSLLNFVIV